MGGPYKWPKINGFHFGYLVRGKPGQNTLPSLKLTAKTPENGWLEDEFPFGMAYFQVRTVSFREEFTKAHFLKQNRTSFEHFAPFQNANFWPLLLLLSKLFGGLGCYRNISVNIKFSARMLGSMFSDDSLKYLGQARVKLSEHYWGQIPFGLLRLYWRSL